LISADPEETMGEVIDKAMQGAHPGPADGSQPQLGVPGVDPVEPAGCRIRTGLESCGLCAPDTAAVLVRLASGASLDLISRQIAAGQLLRKRSRSGRKHVLTAIRRRYLQALKPLPRIPEVAAALRRITAPVGRHQVLLPYLLLADRAAYEVATGLVLSRLAFGGRLTKAEVVEALDALLASRGQKRWCDALRKRWAEGLLSVLRDIGAVGRGRRREELQAYSVRPEAFCFHLWGLYDNGLRGSPLHESPFWRGILLQPEDARRMVGLVSDRGWWKFTSLGGTDEVVPVHGSLMEWIAVGLG
jgi:hypothetical protein